MSEFINNRDYRKNKLKELILQLHDGVPFEEVKAAFEKLTIDVSASEITEMEQALVDEGMPVENIQRLCDVHAAVFKGSIEDIHSSSGNQKPEDTAGHPVWVFKQENRAIEKVLNEEVLDTLAAYGKNETEENQAKLVSAVKRLQTIDKHYRRKENLLFPIMEKYNITAPPQVMWGVDDEIREKIKDVLQALRQKNIRLDELTVKVSAMVEQVREMIFKEENIMFPMTLEAFNESDWAEIEAGSPEIGFTLFQSIDRREPIQKTVKTETEHQQKANGAKLERIAKDTHTEVAFDAGILTAEEINAILNTVPLDMTFVGADKRVKYFTQGKERVFERPLTIIGREVKNCHPPKSVHIVEKIVADLESGKKEHEDFWIRMGELFVYIRYFAVRSKTGKFLGVLEVTQNIKSITELEGEKRLMS